MKTVVVGPRPAEIDDLIRRRQAQGSDLFDEVWQGEYHMVPAAGAAHGYIDNVLAVLLDPLARLAGLTGTGPFNLGDPTDYRVPDRGYHRDVPRGTWLATAAIVVEIVSPDDETYAKFGFYFARAVDEILVADPSDRRIEMWVRDSDRFRIAPRSQLLDVSSVQLTAAITWPETS
ncbi:MAG: Uma2 family endonuclease [Acidimicrobiales bacterium]